MTNIVSNNIKTNTTNYTDRKYGLKRGMIFKNYPSLCDFLEWKIAGGKEKQLQMRELDRHCKYHKEGNKIIIDEVFENPVQKVDGRVHNRGIEGNKGNTIYDELLDYLIVQMIEDHTYCTFSFYQMFYELIPLLSEEYSKIYEMGGRRFMQNTIICQ